jgi:hypothetical protein
MMRVSSGRKMGWHLPILGLLAASLGSPARAAGPVYWDYPEAVAFQEFDLRGAALDRYGRLTPGLASTMLLANGPEIIWMAVDDGKGGLYLGSGHDGQIWHLDAEGDGEVFATVPEPEIFAVLHRGGELFAGGGPDGLLYRLERKGEAEIWADLPEGYIWDMAAGSEGALYLAVGSPAAVYRVSGRQDVTRLAVMPAANALSVAVDADGTLLVCTQGPGLIYRLDPRDPGKPHLIYETSQEEVRELATGPDGLWYALAISRQGDHGNGNDDDEVQVQMVDGIPLATIPGDDRNGGGKGKEKAPPTTALYRLDRDGLTSEVWRSPYTLLAVAWSETWGWLGAGVIDRKRGQAALLTLDESAVGRTLATWEAGDVLDLLVDRGAKGRETVTACLAHTGRVVRLADAPAAESMALSPPIDGNQPIRWGRLRWEGTPGSEGRVRIAVRGGARAVPDDTWSDWSDTWTEADHTLDLPPSRFLQWRLAFTGDRSMIAVSSVTVSGFAPNLPPRIQRFELQPEGQMSPGGLLSHDDNITETFPNGLRVEYSMSSRQQRKAGLVEAAAARPLRTFLWRAEDPNGDRLVYRLEYQRVDEKTWRPVGKKTPEMVQTWDTAGVPDGLYVVRLNACDDPDNPPDEALCTSELSEPIQVDTTPPEIRKFQVARIATGLRLTFEARDASSPLSEAWLELPDGTQERLDPVDSICDSRQERFDRQVSFPPAGEPEPPEPWRVRVEVSDRLGNVAAEEGEAK